MIILMQHGRLFSMRLLQVWILENKFSQVGNLHGLIEKRFQRSRNLIGC
jgi:hypothetical protein